MALRHTRKATARRVLVFAFFSVILLLSTYLSAGPYLSLPLLRPTPKLEVFGKWGPRILVPLVPAAAAVLPVTGQVLIWAADRGDVFGASENKLGQTMTAIFNPQTGEISHHNITVTNHNMFCPGISMNAWGSPVITGGSTSSHTSIYNTRTDRWVTGPQMVVGRGYHAQATLSNGRIFTIGGSWSGGLGGKVGEVLDPLASTWSLLPECIVEPIFTNDSKGLFASDNHPWLFAWKSDSVFQAGPSSAMNWYGTRGNGSHRAAGTRAADADSMNGNAIMFDAVGGKILTLGGATSYTDAPSTRAAHVITLSEPFEAPEVEEIQPMHYNRTFANSVVLPTGDVFINGGVTWAKQWTDVNASLIPEIWSPRTQKFSALAQTPIPRSYHSVALLLPDATVLVGGGGLCWGTCEDPSANHLNLQIFSPPYLFTRNGNGLAVRPRILEISNMTISLGSEFVISTNAPVVEFALIRYASATHSINTDQRRVQLTAAQDETELSEVRGGDISAISRWNYLVRVPSDGGILIPGYWMLFAIDSNGAPSVAETILVSIDSK